MFYWLSTLSVLLALLAIYCISKKWYIEATIISVATLFLGIMGFFDSSWAEAIYTNTTNYYWFYGQLGIVGTILGGLLLFMAILFQVLGLLQTLKRRAVRGR